MNPPPPSDPQYAERAAEVMEWLAKMAGSLGVLWVFLAKIGKPFLEWRRELREKQHATLVVHVRAAMQPELEMLARVAADGADCKEATQRTEFRVDELFTEFDAVVAIIVDNRERLDEQNQLLDQVFNLDRRIDPERRRQIDATLTDLANRRKAARRNPDPEDRTP